MNCESFWACSSNERCDPVTGMCSCVAGWMGSVGSQGIVAGFSWLFLYILNYD